MATLTRRPGQVAAACIVLAAIASPAPGQSLAEVARQEAARRRAVRGAGKVYSNDNLTPDFTVPAPQAPVPAATGADVTGAPAEPVAATGAAETPGTVAPASDDSGRSALARGGDVPEPPAGAERDERYWRGRAQSLRSRLAAQARQIDLLRNRMALFAPGTVSAERDAADRALARALEDQRQLQEEWDGFELSAVEQGVPDAWIR